MSVKLQARRSRAVRLLFVTPDGPRLTLHRHPPVYAALSICYCAIQIIFLAATWQVNHGAGRRLEFMVETTGNGTKEFTFLDYDTGSPQLRLCADGISTVKSKDDCPVIWPKVASSGASPAPAGDLTRRGDDITITFFPDNGTLDVTPYDGLKVNGNTPTSTVTLHQDCVQALKWPYEQCVNDNFLPSILLIVL
jgi:hypothetical protein